MSSATGVTPTQDAMPTMPKADPCTRPRADGLQLHYRQLSLAPLTVRSMPPSPRITGRELVRALGKLGWVVVVQKGSHAQLKHPSRSSRVTVPLHAGETIGPRLLRSILSQARTTEDEFRSVL
jgi:predicted RNA binding protein YcfA (HicA-like mRNA interferase family)